MPFDPSTAKVIGTINNTSPNEPVQDEEIKKRFDPSTAQVVVKPEADLSDTIAYGFEKGESDVTNTRTILESKFPSIYKANKYLEYSVPKRTEDGKYKVYSIEEGRAEAEKEIAKFDSLKTEDQRREYINKQKQDYIDKKYSYLSEKDKNSGGAMTGEILKALATPTTAIPIDKLMKFEKGLKGLSKFAGVSGLFGAEYSALDQYAKTGKIDPKQLAIDTGISAVGGGVIKTGIDGAGKIIKKTSNVLQDMADAKKNKAKIVQANDAMDEIEFYAAKAVKDGVPENQVMQSIADETGIPVNQIKTIINQADKPPRIPKTPEEAQKIFDNTGFNKEDFGKSFLAKTIVPIHTTLKKLNGKVAARLRRYEADTHFKTLDLTKRIKPFLEDLQLLSKARPQAYREISRHLFNGNFGTVEKILKKEIPTRDINFKETIKVLNEIRDELYKYNPKMGGITNYFPRKVEDLKGFYKAIGKPAASRMRAALDKRANDLGVKTIDLPEDEVVKIANQQLKGSFIRGGGPSFTKERTVMEVEDAVMPFYQDAKESLTRYIRSSVNSIEKSKLFGKNLTFKDEGSNLIDVKSSVGKLIADDIDELGDRADQIGELLEIRFSQGELSPIRGMQNLRSMVYGATIANPESALVQMGDLGVSSYMQKFGNAFKSMIGDKKVTMEDLGLEDIAADFNDSGKLAKYLDKAFTYTGFRKIDRLGKNTLINAALKRYKSIVTNKGKYAKEFEEFKNKYKDSFDEDSFKQLGDDLKNGVVSDDVKYLLFNELADAQPITLSEMPQYYLQFPNARLAYALKSFTLKQLDLLRKTVYDQYKAGNKKEALTNAGMYLVMVTGANTTVDQVRRLMNGKPVGISEFREDFADNVLNIFGASKYVTERYFQQGKPVAGFFNMISPPVGMIDYFVSDAMKLLEPDDGSFSFDDKPADYKSIKYVPVVGRALYLLTGGYEKQKADAEKRERAKEAFKF